MDSTATAGPTASPLDAKIVDAAEHGTLPASATAAPAAAPAPAGGAVTTETTTGDTTTTTTTAPAK